MRGLQVRHAHPLWQNPAGGSSDRAAVAYAHRAGLDVVVLDHHQLQGETPPEAIVASVQLAPPGDPHRDLCAAGLSYLVVSHLAREGFEISTPVTVAGLSNVVSISGGGSFTCAVLTDGSARCWGNNYEGELGDGTATPSAMPVPVSGIGSVVEISGGWAHACARLSDGTLRCWGEGTNGELGNGALLNATTPVSVSGISTAVALAGGWYHHSCALLADTSVRCWGTNEWGQFGNGTTVSSSVPAAMSGVALAWTSSNPAVATINASGRATAVAPGTTTITATDAIGAVATTTLTVTLPSYTLTVVKSGVAASLGTVSSSPGGISCGANCSASYLSGTVVTLTAHVSAAPRFDGWSGACTGIAPVCTVTMDGDKAAIAAFGSDPVPPRTLNVTLDAAPGASGRVVSDPAGIDCPGDCSETYLTNTLVTLTASCGLMAKFEWPLLHPGNEVVARLSAATRDVCEYVVGLSRDFGLAPGLQPIEGGVTVHHACHARAQNMGAKSAEMLRLIPGAKVDMVERCSGHGGTFGVMKETRPIAMKVGAGTGETLAKPGGKYLPQSVSRLKNLSRPATKRTRP